jgi:hypothetical protein
VVFTLCVVRACCSLGRSSNSGKSSTVRPDAGLDPGALSNQETGRRHHAKRHANSALVVPVGPEVGPSKSTGAREPIHGITRVEDFRGAQRRTQPSRTRRSVSSAGEPFASQGASTETKFAVGRSGRRKRPKRGGIKSARGGLERSGVYPRGTMNAGVAFSAMHVQAKLETKQRRKRKKKDRYPIVEGLA